MDNRNVAILALCAVAIVVVIVTGKADALNTIFGGVAGIATGSYLEKKEKKSGDKEK